MRRIKGILLNDEDNVATALGDALAADVVEFTACNSLQEITLVQDVPYGFKFALCPIRKGDKVIKYGEVIGLATEDIKTGDMVHVHNVEGQRARGDLTT